jgi:dihydropteroate synthase
VSSPGPTRAPLPSLTHPVNRAAGAHWRVRGRPIALDRPVILGIVNVTPDSFSDAGSFLAPEAAVAHAERLVQEGADILDVGGESTRPQGAVAVTAAEECRRVVPVVRELHRRFPEVPISVDTVKAETAAAALAEGAAIVNDVSGFRLDAALAGVCAEHGAGAILMHSRGGVSEMGTYAYASYGDDVVGEVLAELGEAVERARAAGLPDEAIVLDPGVGFAKRSAHSLAVLAELPRLAALGFPVLVGVSRKRLVGELTGVAEPARRVYGTVGANVAALARGARLFRVHDVRPSREALDVAWAVFTTEGAR